MKTYLRTIIGEGQYREDLAEAFVSAGREALAFLEREGAVKYSAASALARLLSG